MIKERAIEPTLRRAARDFPAVVLTGPRQSGKTTLLKALFASRGYGYVTFDAPDVRAAALADPRGFLARHPAPLVLDEAQHVPELFSYLKEAIDADRRPGRFILSGSQNLALTKQVSESLAGRAAMLHLLPMSMRELSGSPHAAPPWERHSGKERGRGPYRQLWRSVLRGGYPELALNTRRDFSLWQASYIQTWLERDVRGLRAVGDLSQFQLFLRALAARVGQLLNLSDVSRELGIAVNTAKAWLSVLEATWQVFLLRPWHVNSGKRLVKSPRLYFGDLGTVCWLAGLRDPAHAQAGPLGGVLFENAVILEVMKTFVHRGETPSLWFWRTSDGHEVDLLIETPTGMIPIEVKLNETPVPPMTQGIESLRRQYPGQIRPGYLVHPGSSRLPLGGHVTALPFSEL